jgi:hypothetical protein
VAQRSFAPEETALFPLPHQHDDLFRYLISTMTFSVALSVGPRADDTTVFGIEEDGMAMRNFMKRHL